MIRKAYKAARSRNLPRGIIIWSSFKFRFTARNLLLLYQLFSSSSYLIIFIHLVASLCGHTDSHKYKHTKKLLPSLSGTRAETAPTSPKTCVVNAPWRSLENFGESETSSGDRSLGALAAGHKERKEENYKPCCLHR